MSEPAQPWTVKRLLEWTSTFFARKNVDPARLSAELLLSHVLNVPRIKLYTGYETIVPETALAGYRELVRRASEQEPIAYLTGKAPFFNLEFHVTRDVLIPRPDTETVVENVLQLARRTAGFETPRILDLCTGSGCIAAAIVKHHKNASVVAIDLSPAAIEVAKGNFDRLGVADRITLLQGDLFEPLAGHVDPHPFDMIVSNPPYIATDKIPTLDKSVKDYEPMIALDGGPDGLDLVRRIVEGSPSRLRSGGRVFIEIAFDQADQAITVARQITDLDDIRVLKDHAGKDRVLAATRK